MKKLFALLITLCLLAPVCCMAEAGDYFTGILNDGQALVCEVSFTPGTLPYDLTAFQTLYEDIIKALGFKGITQKSVGKDYQSLSLLLGDETALSIGVLSLEDGIYIDSELLGGQPLGFLYEELFGLIEEAMTAFGDSMAEMLPGGTEALDMLGDMEQYIEEFAQLGGEFITLIMGYLDKATITEGDFAIDGADHGITSALLELSGDDIRQFIREYARIMSDSEFASSLFMQSADLPDGITADDTWEMIAESIPDSAGITVEIVINESEEIVYGALTVYDDTEAEGQIVYKRLTEAAETRHTFAVVTLYDAEVYDVPFALCVTAAHDGGAFAVEILIENEPVLRVSVVTDVLGDTPASKLNIKLETPDISVGLNFTFNDSETEKLTTATFLLDDKALITVNVKLYAAESLAFPDINEAIHLLKLSEDEMERWQESVMMNALALLDNAVNLLPASVQALLESMF
jgi:hypothetical protein